MAVGECNGLNRNVKISSGESVPFDQGKKLTDLRWITDFKMRN